MSDCKLQNRAGFVAISSVSATCVIRAHARGRNRSLDQNTKRVVPTFRQDDDVALRRGPWILSPRRRPVCRMARSLDFGCPGATKCLMAMFVFVFYSSSHPVSTPKKQSNKSKALSRQSLRQKMYPLQPHDALSKLLLSRAPLQAKKGNPNTTNQAIRKLAALLFQEPCKQQSRRLRTARSPTCHRTLPSRASWPSSCP